MAMTSVDSPSLPELAINGGDRRIAKQNPNSMRLGSHCSGQKKKRYDLSR